MVAGARTFSLEESFLPAQILNPPPTRHALLAFLLALAAVLHIGTAGWGDLYDGTEGQVAAAAREMVQSGNWLVPSNNGVPLLRTPPLTCWMVAGSFKIFGTNATAARLPFAFAMIGLVAFTFLIGERLAGYWRGFAAGLVLLSSSGAFFLGRVVSLDVPFALFVCAAVYCLVRGYQHQKFRRLWFAGFWFCAGLASLTKGPGAILYLAVICALLAIFFREARLRFRPLLHWTNFLFLVAIVAPSFIWAQRLGLGFFHWSASSSGFSRWHSLLLHLAWWFPALFLVLPGFIFRPRKILRPDEITLADRLPLAWLFVGLLVEMLLAERTSAAIAIAPAVALVAACAWQRMARPLRALGLVLALLAGASFAAIVWFSPAIAATVFRSSLDDTTWSSLTPLLQIAAGSFFFCAIVALIFLRQRGEITLVVALAAMVPVGWCLIEGRARVAPFFSLADAADYLNSKMGPNGEVIYEGSIESASSLSFYLDKKFFLVNETVPALVRDSDTERRYLDEHFVLEAWDRSDPLYLIIDASRVGHWQRLIIDRVHIYHQVTSCGSRVVLSNQL
jgi:4-amino-4-deoxy-L-arabinose transferase-like glycosyltransferase